MAEQRALARGAAERPGRRRELRAELQLATAGERGDRCLGVEHDEEVVELHAGLHADAQPDRADRGRRRPRRAAPPRRARDDEPAAEARPQRRRSAQCDGDVKKSSSRSMSTKTLHVRILDSFLCMLFRLVK